MLGPNRRTDARHRITASATMQLPMGFRVAPIFIFRSALPVYIGEGVDLNLDGELNDLPERAVAFDGFDSNGVVEVQGHRRLHDDQLRPRRRVLAAEPPRVASTFRADRAAPTSRRSARSSTCSTPSTRPTSKARSRAWCRRCAWSAARRTRPTCSRRASRATSSSPSSAWDRSGSASRSNAGEAAALTLSTSNSATPDSQ